MQKPTTGGYAYADDISIIASMQAPPPVPNLALNKTATAGSVYGVGYEGGKAFDWDVGTRRAAAAGAADPQWLSIDLRASISVDYVKVNLNGSYAAAYQIQVSTDGATWTNVYSTSAGPGENTAFVAASARYVRLLATARSDPIHLCI